MINHRRTQKDTDVGKEKVNSLCLLRENVSWIFILILSGIFVRVRLCASAANEGRVMFMKEEHENRELNFFQNLLIFSDFCVILKIL